MRTLTLTVLLASLAPLGSPRTAEDKAVEVVTIPLPAPIGSFQMSKSARLAAAICQDWKMRVWRLPDKQLLRTIDLGGKRTWLMGISDDGRWILTGAQDGDVTVWDASSGETQFETRLERRPGVGAFSHDGAVLAVGPADGPVEVYDLASRRKLYDLRPAVGGTEAIAFSRDDSRIATADSADTAICVYDARTGKLVSRNTDFVLEPFTVDFTPDGKQVLAGGANAAIDLIDVTTGQLVRQVKKTAEPVEHLEISPDGKYLSAASFRADNGEPLPMVILKISSGEEAAEGPLSSSPYWGGWTTDGQMLVATATEKAVHVWRVY